MNIKELNEKFTQLKSDIKRLKFLYLNADLGSDQEIEYALDLDEARHQLDKLLNTKLGDLIGYDHEH